MIAEYRPLSSSPDPRPSFGPTPPTPRGAGHGRQEPQGDLSSRGTSCRSSCHSLPTWVVMNEPSRTCIAPAAVAGNNSGKYPMSTNHPSRVLAATLRPRAWLFARMPPSPITRAHKRPLGRPARCPSTPLRAQQPTHRSFPTPRTASRGSIRGSTGDSAEASATMRSSPSRGSGPPDRENRGKRNSEQRIWNFRSERWWARKFEFAFSVPCPRIPSTRCAHRHRAVRAAVLVA
jgi:hypothetical protein